MDSREFMSNTFNGCSPPVLLDHHSLGVRRGKLLRHWSRTPGSFAPVPAKVRSGKDTVTRGPLARPAALVICVHHRGRGVVLDVEVEPLECRIVRISYVYRTRSGPFAFVSAGIIVRPNR